MDTNTIKFIESLHEPNKPREKIMSIYIIFKKYDNIPLTLDIISYIYSNVVIEFYNNLNDFLIKSNKRTHIKITNTGISSGERIESFLETKAYDKNDAEFSSYDYGFDIPLDFINALKGDELFYSGGYTTNSRVIFIILCILHEIIHIIEFSDSHLSSTLNDHTIFFYLLGYKVFKQISRISEIIDNPTDLNYHSKERIDKILKFKKRKNIILNGADILNDHTHYINNSNKPISIGYVTYISPILEVNNNNLGNNPLERIQINNNTKKVKKIKKKN